MSRGLLLMAFVWSWILPLQTWAEGPLRGADLPPGEGPESQPEQQCPPGYRRHAEWGRCVMDTVAGIPFEEAWKIFERHREKLGHLPGVSSVWLGAEGIVVETDKRQVLPKEVEGLPLIVSPAKEYLPPPPGVIILRPGGVREQADSCPEGFKEHVSLGGWRFCIDPEHPETIPPLMALPIAGIPYEEALAILERHREEIMRLPGVQSVGMGNGGIVVETDNPAVLPLEIEGLPIKPIPPGGLKWDLSL